MSTMAEDAPTGAALGKVIPLPGVEPQVVTFEDTFRTLFPRAKRVAHRILREEALAEDAAAEAFARAHASWRKVGAAPHRDAWILRVTANVAIDMGRRRRRLTFVGLSPRHDAEAVPAEPGLTELAGVLKGLPRRQREIIVLRYLDGLPEADVAAALGISVGTVKKESFVARRALRALLTDPTDD